MSSSLAIAIAVGLVIVAAVVICRISRQHALKARLRKREEVRDTWLNRLLPVLEGQQPPRDLPHPLYQEEMQTVMALLEELAGTFRGQYRDRLRAIVRHIGADSHALHLLTLTEPELKIRGCALLAWSGPDTNVDLQLSRALGDPSWQVRLEAAAALAVRQPLGLTLESLLIPLRGTPAMDSDRTLEMVQLMAPSAGRGDELAKLLMKTSSARERVILLAGLAMADDLMQADVVAWQLSDYAPEVRCRAVRTLERLGDPAQISKVLTLVEDADPEVRLAVAEYATSMGGQAQTLTALDALAKDKMEPVAKMARQGLARWVSAGATALTAVADTVVAF